MHAPRVQLIQPLECIHLPAARPIDQRALSGELARRGLGRVGRLCGPYQ
jgi:hypothetical protein